MAYRQGSKGTNGGTKCFAIGGAAQKIVGRAPEPIVFLNPLKEGVISSYDSTVEMVGHFLAHIKNKQIKNNFWKKPDFIISLPSCVSEYEAKAVRQLGKDVGANNVFLVEEPLAAALGENISVLSSRGCMVLDLGAGTSEAVVISCGGTVLREALRLGGEQLSVSIADHLRFHHGFLVGEQTAEKMKCSIAHISREGEEKRGSFGGLNLHRGLPEIREWSSALIKTPVEAYAKQILALVRKTLAQIPPEISADILDTGILLTGGGALLSGMDEYLQTNLRVPVIRPADPLVSVSRGGFHLLKNRQLLEKICQ